MRSLLSRLAFWWAALAVGLCLLLPSPQGTWVAALAVAAAALSLLMGRGGRPRMDVAGPAPAAAIEEAGLLETAAMVVRSAAHAHDLPEALHSVARILFQELGAEGLVTGRLDDTGAPQRLDRFADPAARGSVALQEAMSALAADATGSQRVCADPQGAFAVPVLRDGRTVAWLEFTGLEMAIATPALLRLLELVRLELSAVAQRSVRHPKTRPQVSEDTGPWRDRDAANAPTLAGSHMRRPAPNESRALLVRYPRPRFASGAEPAPSSAGVLDQHALDRLRELDPSGVNRLLERVVKAFETSATRLIPKLRDGAINGDLDGVRQVAHTLKSASASIGAVKLSRLCADIETHARAEDGDDLASRVKAMIGEIDTVLSVLRSLPVPRA
jgi:HPt (histidine-containing phosphotransfer) domain-containing protein